MNLALMPNNIGRNDMKLCSFTLKDLLEGETMLRPDQSAFIFLYLSGNMLMTVENKCFNLHLNWVDFPATNLN